VDTFKAGIDQGLKGSELGLYVYEQFSYPVGEKPARPNPVEQLRAQHNALVAEGLGGLTIQAAKELEVAEASKK
jgi:hypothetical protein